MRQLQCVFESFSVSFNENQGMIIVSAKSAPEGVWPAHLRPTLCDGRRAHHLSIPLLPRHSGPEAGNFWPHLTYIWKDERGKEIKAHRPLALIRAEEAESFGEAAMNRMLEQVHELLVPADLRELAADGWQLRRVAASFRESAQEAIDQRRRIRVGEVSAFEAQMAERAQELAEPVSAQSLLQIRGDVPPEIHIVRRTGDDRYELLGYLFRPASAPQGRWFILKAGALLGFMHDFRRELLPAMAKYALLALQEMQADLPKDILDDLLSGALVEQSAAEEFFGWRF